MSICIAIIPPKPVIDKIRGALQAYSSTMNVVSPENTWHIPLCATPHVPELATIRQSFHQTLRMLSIGEGEVKGSLAVRIQQSPSLEALIASLPIQNTAAVPELFLGSFEQVPALGIIDTPLALTFNIRELTVIQTDPYEIIGTIRVTP